MESCPLRGRHIRVLENLKLLGKNKPVVLFVDCAFFHYGWRYAFEYAFVSAFCFSGNNPKRQVNQVFLDIFDLRARSPGFMKPPFIHSLSIRLSWLVKLVQNKRMFKSEGLPCFYNGCEAAVLAGGNDFAGFELHWSAAVAAPDVLGYRIIFTPSNVHVSRFLLPR